VDIYSFCGNSGVFTYANGGDISVALWPHDAGTDDDEHHEYGEENNNLSKLEKLHIGRFMRIRISQFSSSNHFFVLDLSLLFLYW
jgi:hypothetical protein